MRVRSVSRGGEDDEGGTLHRVLRGVHHSVDRADLLRGVRHVERLERQLAAMLVVVVALGASLLHHGGERLGGVTATAELLPETPGDVDCRQHGGQEVGDSQPRPADDGAIYQRAA